MARKKKRTASDDPNAELLPPREALTILPIEPTTYAGLLGDPTAAGAAPAPASSAADTADDLVDAQASGSGEETASEQPQTITRDDTQTASSET